MPRIHFQNGPDAPEILLDEELEADEFDAKRDELLSIYRTRPEAVIWLEGQGKPPFPGDEPEDEKPAPKAEPAAKAEAPKAKPKPPAKPSK